jgi:hypothetical protein
MQTKTGEALPAPTSRKPRDVGHPAPGEEDLIGSSEKVAQYTTEATRHAARYEWAYQKKMSEPAAKPFSK